MGSLNTAAGLIMLQNALPLMRRALSEINTKQFSLAKSTTQSVKAEIAAANFELIDDIKNDLYVIESYAHLIESYATLWERVMAHQFSASWSILQDCLDLTRLVKRFSGIDVTFFENQLTQLENAYPYNVFFSIGAEVGWFECSICGNDYDSDECEHISGNLYGGKLAHRIAHDLSADHIAMVSNPKDKRCVVQYEDTGDHFKLVRYIASIVSEGKFEITSFQEIQFQKVLRPNEEFRDMGRNELCFCGSGLKFKRCCIDKRYIEGDHAQCIFQPICIDCAIRDTS